MNPKTATHKQGPSTTTKKSSHARRPERPMTPARSAEQVVERLLDERGRPVTEFFRQHPVLGAAAAAGAGLALASAIGVGEIAVGLAAGYAAYLALRERIAGRESLRAGGGRGAVVREGRREERAR